MAKKKTKTKTLGRPKLELTDEQIKLASKLAGIGCTLNQISHILDVSPATLDRRIADDERLCEALEKGRAMAQSKVLNAAFNMAISEKNPYMTSFWLRCKLGWAEPKGELPGDDPFNLNYARPAKEHG